MEALKGSAKDICFFFLIILLLALFHFFAPPPSASAGDCIEKRGLIILTQYPDVEHKVSGFYAKKRFFDELNEYVQEMSYGTVCITGDVTRKWYTMPDPVSQYRISPRNLEVDKSRIEKLLGDVLAAADNDTDFSRYDFTAVFMGARRDEYGMIGLCGYPGMLGWSAADKLQTPSGQEVRGGMAIFSYQAHLGTLFHDVAHILGGVKDGKRMVPCLYDHDLQAAPGDLRETFLGATINMGLWDPMSSHYNEWKAPPPGLSSWTKLRLGFMPPAKVKTVRQGSTAEVLLGPLEEGNHPTLAIKIPLSDTTYYLIENRQPIGFDRSLPGSGVLIMFADDTVAECRRGKAPVKLVDASPDTPHLRGAAFDMGAREVFTDSKHGVRVELREKVGKSYRIVVSVE